MHSLTPKRPIYLNLLQIRLPIAGVLSIAHRVTGLLLVLSVPLLTLLLQQSLAGAEGFAAVVAQLHSWPGRIALLLALWALLHHLLAGIRYLLIDLDIGVERPRYRYSAWLVLLVAPLLALLAVWGLNR